MSTSGWEQYPLNFSHLLPHEDLNFYHRGLTKNSARLFSAETPNIKLQAVVRKADDSLEAQITTIILESEESVELTLTVSNFGVPLNSFAYIKQKQLGTSGDHFIFLTQDHTWAPFNISESALRKIFTAVEVLPMFLNLLYSFGHPHLQCDVDLPCGYHCRISDSIHKTTDFDLCYEVQYISKTGRESWPWSLKRMGIYQRYRCDDRSSRWVILQPARQATKLPLLYTTLATPDNLHLGANIFLVKSTLAAWKPYLRHCGSQLRRQSQRIRHSSKELDLTSCSEILQDLQYQCEVLHDVVAALHSNKETLAGLRLLFENVPKHERKILKHDLNCCMSQLRLDGNWAANLITQTKQMSALLSTAISSKHNEVLVKHTGSMNQLALSARMDCGLMLELSKATKKDSTSMTQVATMTLIYLPGSFMATLFSTGFVTVPLTDNNPSVRRQVIMHACIYVAVTIFLLVLIPIKSLIWNSRIPGRRRTAE